MSRTIRRKHAYNRSYYVKQPHEIDQYDMKRYGCSTPKECCDRIKAWFHSDNHPGGFGVPRWYRSERNKNFARSADSEVYRCLVSGEWDGHLPVKYMRDAGWYWW